MHDSPEDTEDAPREVASVEDDPELGIERHGFARGFFRSLRESFHPILTAGAYARGDTLGRPLVFAVLTLVPLALASGVVPFTHTLTFGDGFGVNVIEGRGPVGPDVVRAAGIGLLLVFVRFLAVSLAFASLCKAFGQLPPGAQSESLSRIAWRASLMRAHWLPLQGATGLVAGLVAWGMPRAATGNVALLLVALLVVASPLVMHFVTLRHAAIRSCGVSRLASLAVVLVPFVLAGVLEHILIGDGYEPGGLLRDWLPVPTPAPE